MAKQSINLGTPNGNNGDPLRTAFSKVNENFTEIYTALGLNADSTLNIGAFEFDGSIIRTVDSTAITIDQTTTVTSHLTVGGDLLPEIANNSNLGSAAKPWGSLYVSNSTIYIGGTPLAINQSGQLTVGGVLASASDRLSHNGDEVVLVGGANPYVTFPAITGGDQLQISGAEVAALSGNLAFSGQTTITLITNGAGAGGVGSQYFTLGADGSLTIPGTIGSDNEFKIEVNVSDSTKHTWRFGEDGELTVPGRITLGTDANILGYGDFVGLYPSSTSGSTGLELDAINDALLVGTRDVIIRANGDSPWKNWTFKSTGDLQLPGNLQSNGNIDIEINLADSTMRRWSFGEDGDLRFPDGTAQSTAFTGNRLINGTDKVVLNEQGASRLSMYVNNIEKSRLQVNTNDLLFSSLLGGVQLAALDGAGGDWYFRTDGELHSAGGKFLSIAETPAVFGSLDSPLPGASSGTVTIKSGTGAVDGGSIYIQAGTGTTGNNGEVAIRTGTTPYEWQFDNGGNLTIPGEIHGKQLIGVGGVPNGRVVNITPADNASDKKFKFRVDQYGETFTRAYLDMPEAPNNKQVAISFAHENNTVGYIFNQGADTFDDGLNNAFNIFYNAGDIKLTAMTPVTGTFNTWKFGSNGDLTIPGDIQSEEDISIRINLADSTTRTWRFGEDGDLTFPDNTVQTTAFTGNAATVDITNTNGIDTNYSITFVENRDGAEILRADVDLTFNSWSNTLTAGNVAVKQTLTGGIIANGSDFIITSQSNPDRDNACNIGIFPGGATGTASEAGFVSITGGSSDVVGLAGGDVYIRGGAHTNGGVSGTIKVESILKIDDGVHEKFQTKADATGVVTHDCASGHVFYHTSPDANWTVNLTNLNLSSNYATAVTLVIVQGGTGYYPSAVQIGGVAQTLNWQGNATPTPSTNRTDVVTFSIINNSGTYTVLGQLTGF